MSKITYLAMDATTEKSKHQVISTGPLNFCKTPSPAGPVPIPYPNKLDSGSCTGAKKVNDGDGKKCLNMKSDIKATMPIGDEAGVAKDITTSQTTGKAWALVGAFTVLIEGAPGVFTGSVGFSNSA